MPNTPLCSFYSGCHARYVTPIDISTTLKTSVLALDNMIGFSLSNVSQWSLQAASAMALLCTQVDTKTIKLLGRWCSDEMLHYLMVQAAPDMSDFAKRMLMGHGGQLNSCKP
jgi:hypothetical protein